MKILVVGAGAMGSLYGGRLKYSGCHVVLVDIWEEQIKTINNHGLKIEGNEGTRVVSIPACFAGEVKEKADLLIIFTKTYHSEKAMQSILHLIHAETLAMTLQNGLGNAEIIEKYFPRERTIVGTTNFPSDLLAPGHIRSLGSGETRIMPLGGSGAAKVQGIKEILDAAGFNCKIVGDIFPSIWEKIAFNAAFSSLTSVTGLTVGRLGETAEGRELVFQIVDEVLDIAKRKDIAVEAARVKAMLEEAFVQHFAHEPSMLQDLKAGKMTEINSINGAVVREAVKIGRTVPLTETLYKLVRILEQARQAQV